MSETELNAEELVQHHIGEPGVEIRRIKEKTLRTSVARRLKAEPNAWPPDIRLRAYLAIGRTPEPGLLNGAILRRALSTSDCASFASLLTTRRMSLDADAVLSTLAELVSRDRKIRARHELSLPHRTIGNIVHRQFDSSDQWQG